eukprot:4036104-Pleurochrysis_carterae.AAC.1
MAASRKRSRSSRSYWSRSIIIIIIIAISSSKRCTFLYRYFGRSVADCCSAAASSNWDGAGASTIITSWMR